MDKICPICGGHMSFSGCDRCGKLVFEDKIYLIKGFSSVPAKIRVTTKKIQITETVSSGFESAGKVLRRAVLDRGGVMGMMASSALDQEDDNDNCHLIYFSFIKKFKVTKENCIIIKEDEKVTIEIENGENRMKLIELLHNALGR